MKKSLTTFKEWFSLMWLNFYIQLFVIALSLGILEFFKVDYILEMYIDNTSFDKAYKNFFGGLAVWIFVMMPWIIIFFVTWLGFIKKWKERLADKQRSHGKY